MKQIKWLMGILVISFLFGSSFGVSDEFSIVKVTPDESIGEILTTDIITIEFNKDLAEIIDEKTIGIYDINDERVHANFIKEGNRSVQIIPKAPFETGKEYVVYILEDFSNINGEKLSSEVQLKFKAVGETEKSKNIIFYLIGIVIVVIVVVVAVLKTSMRGRR